MTTTYKFHSPVETFTISLEKETVKSISTTTNSSLPDLPQDHPVAIELNRFFNGESRELLFAIDPDGTQFQKSVWEELRNIPFGETRTYGDIAKSIGNPKAARAIGMACRANPILLIIPCHRVVSSTGLGGFSAGINLKEKLLAFEQVPHSLTI